MAITGKRNGGKMFLVFNHVFTQDQKQDATASLGIDQFINLPGPIRDIWSQIPADAEEIAPFLFPVQDWLISESRTGDFVMIQGDFGATWIMVGFAFEKGLVPVYSSTARVAEEDVRADGSVQTTHIFKHRRFRLYGR